MEISITGNPGKDNQFNDLHTDTVQSYNPNAQNVYINNHPKDTDSRLACWLRNLSVEFKNNIKLQKKLDDIKRYRTKLPHTIGLDAKLRDGHFSPAAIDKARRQKQYYAKKATKYQYCESAQRIDSYLFGKVCCRFDQYVLNLIEEQQPLSIIKTAVYEKVILPIMAELNEVGSADTELCYNEDDIFGMLYYLTGKCHINWAIYDV